MSTRSKGDRHERQAKALLQDQDYTVHKKVNNNWDNGDIFELFDLIAVRPNRKPVFIQVKTNGTGGDLGETLHKAKQIIDTSHVDLEYWIKYDYKGWRVLRSTNGNDWDEVIDGRGKEGKIGSTVTENYDKK